MNSHWQQDWLKLQKQYMQTLAVAGKSALNSHFEIPVTSTDWGFGAGNPPGHTWEMLSSQFAEILSVLTDDGREDFDWKSALQSYVESAKERIKADMRRLEPADFQTEMLSSFEKLFGSMGARPDSSSKPEVQEIYQYWQLYQQNCLRYRNYLKNIDLASLDIVQEKLFQLADNKENISSLREFYDLWVDCYEEAYETIILSEEYSVLYGELINSLLEFKARSQSVSRSPAAEASANQANLQNELALVRKQQELEEKIRNLIEEKPTAMANAAKKKKSAGKTTRKATGRQAGDKKS